MDMQIRITSRGTGSVLPLQVEVSGYRLELSGIAEGRKLCITEDSGRIAVSIADVGDSPLPEQAQPEAVTPVEQVVEHEVVSEPVQAAAPVVQPVVAEPEQLFQRLVALRKQIAAEVRLPPYIIFHDATLREMSRLLPSDLQTLKAIQGVGQTKLEKYGTRFIQAIREFSAGKAA
ncbi:MAG TPA: HRDC domain-containing protein [Clostridia bacterium]|nr:HRDC domain-containing protein [Clostridia bacterium]